MPQLADSSVQSSRILIPNKGRCRVFSGSIFLLHKDLKDKDIIEHMVNAGGGEIRHMNFGGSETSGLKEDGCTCSLYAIIGTNANKELPESVKSAAEGAGAILISTDRLARSVLLVNPLSKKDGKCHHCATASRLSIESHFTDNNANTQSPIKRQRPSGKSYLEHAKKQRHDDLVEVVFTSLIVNPPD